MRDGSVAPLTCRSINAGDIYIDAADFTASESGSIR
jgi:hypothetical protein